jgi:hypothetical protein
LLPCWESVGTIAIGGVPFRSDNSHIAAERPPEKGFTLRYLLQRVPQGAQKWPPKQL